MILIVGLSILNILLAVIQNVRVRMMVWKEDPIIYHNRFSTPTNAAKVTVYGILTSKKGQTCTMSKTFFVNRKYTLSDTTLWTFLYRATCGIHPQMKLSNFSVSMGCETVFHTRDLKPAQGLVPFMEQYWLTALIVLTPFILMEVYKIEGLTLWVPYGIVFCTGFLTLGVVNAICRRWSRYGHL